MSLPYPSGHYRVTSVFPRRPSAKKHFFFCVKNLCWHFGAPCSYVVPKRTAKPWRTIPKHTCRHSPHRHQTSTSTAYNTVLHLTPHHNSPAGIDSNSAMPSHSQADYDYIFKLLLIGDSGVGKSSLLLRFAGKVLHSRHWWASESTSVGSSSRGCVDTCV